MAVLARHLEPAVEGADAVLQRDEVEAVDGRGLHVDSEEPVAVLGTHGEPGRRRANRLGDERVSRRLDRSGESLVGHDSDPDRHPALLRECIDRRGEPFVGEHGREDPVRELTQVGDREAQLLVGLFEG